METGSFSPIGCLRSERRNRYDAPREGSRKRIEVLDTESDTFVLAYRTWRVRSQIDDANRIVRITDIFNGHTAPELALRDDPHRDKSLHTQFINFVSFPCPD